ncbi:hypothetical protein EV191_1098 [Tamaricihabitans halophyticus]|uniref:Uncharacterized protein n=1 Tax=Tamaricihabitans halophyticus TaxID=1262583 RepID=A0A4V2ST38_9PSEU|nr:hypothetical protein [Tamaricihabitans halophyticus]TCP49186.1 hypothetical protein EV191_1098 [Tamaricihabitans halophyticus]
MAQALDQILLSESKRPEVVTDFQNLIDEEVSGKKGVSGLAVKGVYGTVKAVKSGMIHDAVDSLLDDFVQRLQPFYAEYQTAGGGTPLSEYLSGRGDEVADALLGVTDERAGNSQRKSVKNGYEKLRPQAKKHVEEAVPQIGSLIEKHTA